MNEDTEMSLSCDSRPEKMLYAGKWKESDVYCINMESVKDALMYEEKETASFQGTIQSSSSHSTLPKLQKHCRSSTVRNTNLYYLAVCPSYGFSRQGLNPKMGCVYCTELSIKVHG